MSATGVPDGFNSISAILPVRDLRRAIEFYKAAFGARESLDVHKSVLGHGRYAQVVVGDSVVMLADDLPGLSTLAPDEKAPFCARLYLYVADARMVYERAESFGAKGLGYPNSTYWGDMCGMLRDPDGHIWTIATREANFSSEEVARRYKEWLEWSRNEGKGKV